MLVIRDLSSYRDGGTISMKVNISFEGFRYEGEICLDKRIRDKGDGKLWFGYPEKEGSSIIEDVKLLEHIKKGVIDYKKYQNFKLDELIENLKQR